MPVDSELEEILLRWEELRACGKPVALEELCRDRPDRLAEVRQLVKMLEGLDALIAADGEDTIESPGIEPQAAPLPEEISTSAHYRALHVHARGGLGEVFVAWDQELGREVALKLIQHPYGRDADRRERFLREAEITARLGHPGIVPIFGLGQTGDGRPCYTMRFVEGETLQAAIDRFHAPDGPKRDAHERNLALRALIARLVAVCQAVAFAHSKGVIHRDLKPANVMLGAYQETLVVDWGLAKRWREQGSEEQSSEGTLPDDNLIASSSDSLTRMGSTLGTPAFMSPEQAAGRWDEVGPASDIYSLGATLYCLLTGQAAFQNRSRSGLLDQVRRGEFPPPRQVDAAIPPALEAICLKAMALAPEDRYASAVELAADLDRWLADEPVTAWREPRLVRLARWVRRHRPLVAGTAALTATALLALAVSTLLLGREQSKTKRALDEARANYGLARTTMADVQTSFGLSAAERQAPAEAALWFAEAAATSDVDPERALASRIRARGWSLLSPAPIAMLDIPRMPAVDRGSSPSADRLAFDGRGRYLLADLRGGAFVIHDIATDQQIPLPGHPRVVSASAWGGPEGNLLALGDPGGGVELVRIPEREVVAKLQIPGRVSSMEFSKDGHLLAIGSDHLRVWDLVKQTYATPDLVHPARIMAMAFNAQADRLATAAAEGRVRVYDLASQDAEPLFHTEPSASPPVRFPAEAPPRPLFVDGGRGLITLPTDREILWLDATTGAEVRRLATSLLSVMSVFLSSDGQAIVASGLGGVRSWDANTGRPLGQFGDTGVETAAFTPNGRWLLVSTGYHMTAPYLFPDGAPGDWTLKQQDIGRAIVVSPRGDHFALAQGDGLVRVWRLPQDRRTDTPTQRLTTSARLAMSADGRLVMPLGKYLYRGPTVTQVHDLMSDNVGPDLPVGDVLHGGAIAPDGRQVVTLSSAASVIPGGSTEMQYPVGSSQGWIKFWDWQTGKPLFEPIRTPSEPVAAAYRPDGKRLAVLCALGECMWIDPASGQVLHRRDRPSSKYVPAWPANELLRFSPDGKILVQWGAGSLVLIDGETGADRTPALHFQQYGRPGLLLDAHFSPDGRYLVTTGGDKTARVWDVATGKPATRPLAHPDWVFQGAFSADGSMVLTGCRDWKARVWNWREGKVLGLPMAHQGEVQDVAFLPGDAWALTKCSVGELATSANNAVQVWDWRTGKPLVPARLLPSVWGSALSLSSDGRIAALGSSRDREIHLIDVPAWIGREDPRFPADHLRAIAELYSGQKIVGGSSVVNLRTIEWVERWRLLGKLLRRETP